ncbi:unnamed protein product [Brassicogethes aeneus]|uniref:Uncharacterized protein n=1 Tax=Brassicogethes aeneus TaxID=1431903 RepID=A0A9P0FQ99_BRAAE|nr:unnamed protein product [Brassicogethes aeneus]
MCDLQPTQSPPSSMVLTPPDDNIRIPWGRLISRMNEMDPVDLVSDAVSLGRAEYCDIVIVKNRFPDHIVFHISKEHFVISKQAGGPVFITDLSKNGTFINRQKVGRNNKYVLQNNDIISVGIKDMLIYTYKQMDNFEEKYLPLELQKKYEVGEFLGRGAVGEVRLVYEKTTTKKFAVKKITKGKFNTSRLHDLNHPSKIYSEINILQHLNHPCVISMREIVETEEDVFIILEYMEGGELTSRIEKFHLSEPLVKYYFYQMVLAVKHLHDNNVTHRDLKPENVLLSSNRMDCLLKVSDFGLSKESEDNIMRTMCGTMCYVAPEIIDDRYKEYDNQCDIWSLGVILYYMMSKEFPFNSSDRRSLGLLILRGNFSMVGPKWQNASYPVKDLIRRMLTVNPKERINSRQILQHPWISRDQALQIRVNDLIKSHQKVPDFVEPDVVEPVVVSPDVFDPEPHPKRCRVDGNDETAENTTATNTVSPTLTPPLPTATPHIHPTSNPRKGRLCLPERPTNSPSSSFNSRSPDPRVRSRRLDPHPNASIDLVPK